MSNPKGKKKFVLWAYPSTLQLVENNYKKDNSKSRSEFIERAILFYVGRVNADSDTSYLPTALLSNMKNIVGEYESKQSRMLFKIAVEMAMIMNILAAGNGIDKYTLSALRDNCVKEVKRLNGNFTFADAVKWQGD